MQQLIAYNSNKPKIISSILEIIHYYFYDWRTSTDDDIIHRIKQIVTRYLTKFLEILQICTRQLFQYIEQQKLSNIVVVDKTIEDTLIDYINSVKYQIETIYSLNYIDITSHIQDTLPNVMSILLNILNLSSDKYSILCNTSSILNIYELETTIFYFIISLISHDQESMEQYFIPILDITFQCQNIDNIHQYPEIVVAGLQVLSTIYTNINTINDNYNKYIKYTCEIILPRESRLDEDIQDMFITSPIDYMEFDLFNSHTGSRRQVCINVVQILCKKFPQYVIPLFQNIIDISLQQYIQNPIQNWQSKDCALFFISAVTIKSYTRSTGVLEITNNINISKYFTDHVLTELLTTNSQQTIDINYLPIIKADCLKFIYQFRSILPIDILPNLLKTSIEYLYSSYEVILSYSSLVISSFLELKKDAINGTNIQINNDQDTVDKILLSMRLPSNIVLPQIPMILQNLQLALPKVSSEHVACTLLHVLYIGKNSVLLQFQAELLKHLSEKLLEISKKPINPILNHVLFEIVVQQLNGICKTDTSLLQPFEQVLFPIFSDILSNPSCPEFQSYIFQTITVMLIRSPSITKPYESIILTLFTPSLYKIRTNCIPLLQLLSEYMRKGQLNNLQQRSQIIELLYELVKQLLNIPSLDRPQLNMLSNTIRYIDDDDIKKNILQKLIPLLLQRLQRRKTDTFLTQLCIFFCTCMHVSVQSVIVLIQSINSIQDNLFQIVLYDIQQPSLYTINNKIDKQICVLGFVQLLYYLFNTNILQDRWVQILEMTVILASTCTMDVSYKALSTNKESQLSVAKQLQQNSDKNPVTLALQTTQSTSTKLVFATIDVQPDMYTRTIEAVKLLVSSYPQHVHNTLEVLRQTAPNSAQIFHEVLG